MFRWLRARRLPELAAGAAAMAAVALLFFYFAGGGMRAGFTADDVMNLHVSWFPPLSRLIWDNVNFAGGAYRPMGALFYSAAFELFGLNPLPYRILCFALLLVNLWLIFEFSRLLSGSRAAAAIAALLAAYHPALADLYWNTGTVYDLLCFCFYYLGLNWYLRIRGRGQQPAARQLAGLALLHVAALNSKEMAASMPAAVLLYEWLYQRERRDLRFFALTGAASAAYLLGKITAPSSMLNNPQYALHLSMSWVFDSWRHYLKQFFDGAFEMTDLQMAVLFTGTLAVAASLRRRDMIFAWTFGWLAAIPVLVVLPRSLYALYVALPAWYLLAACFVMLLITARRSSLGFVAMCLILLGLHLRRGPQTPVDVEERERIQNFWTSLSQFPEPVPKGARILITGDPYPPDDIILTSLCRLHFRDKQLNVYRPKTLAASKNEPPAGGYHCAFEWTEEGPRPILNPSPAK